MPDTMIQSPVVSPAMPVEIARAVGEVMTQIKSLPKGEHNSHGGYNFASIDDFLAAVGPLCSAAGLIIYQDEHSIDMIDRAGKAWVKATYSFRLGHTSGVICERPMLRTVFQAITGPQTMGSSQSYSLKQFMRSMFLVPTGERDDADYHPKEPMQGRQEAQERAQLSRRTDAAPGQLEAPQRPPSGIQRIAIPTGNDGLMVGTWTRLALDALAGLPNAAARREWLELHTAEMADVRRLKPDYAARIEATATATASDQPEIAA